MSGMEHGGGAGGTPALFVRSLADVVGVFADRGGVEAVPRIGLKLKLADGKIVVKMAWPDTASAAAGLHPGDRIMDLNGAVPSDIHHLRLALARLRWGDRLDMKVERSGKTIDCAALLEPEVRTVDTTVAPGWKVEAAAPFDPAGVAAAMAAPAAASSRDARLILRGGKAVRVEVWKGKTLVAVHVLDASGRAIRSLYRAPLSGGVVEVRYERAKDGSVTAVRRFDRAGRPVSG
jgi:membrane-associated protease RseP (regulator of RpoE activity)